MGFITLIVLLPLFFIILFFSTGNMSDPMQRYYVTMVSFNINDVVSGVISIVTVVVLLKRFKREHRNSNVTTIVDLRVVETQTPVTPELQVVDRF